MSKEFGVAAASMHELGLERAKDKIIFERARLARAVILTKDTDFVDLVRRHGPPPSILCLTLGNSATGRVQELFEEGWRGIRRGLARGEALIELRARE